MSRAFGIKQLISPSEGLITEQSKLAPVESSTVDEINFSFNDDGSIRIRRPGVNKETSASFFTWADVLNATNATSYAIWQSVAGDGGTNFHVFQIGATLYFIKDATGNLTEQRQTFNFDLDLQVAPAFSTVETSPVSMTSGDGKLFVVGRQIVPFFIEYDSGADTISTTLTQVRIRDFTGLDDGLNVDARPNTLDNAEHDYNLNNQGWKQSRKRVSDGNSIDPIEQFNTDVGDYPSNSDISLLGMVDDGTGNLRFDAEFIEDLSLGNTPAPRGHFIVDPFSIEYEDLRNGTNPGSGGFGGGSGGSGGTDGGSDTGNPNWWKDDFFYVEGED